MESPIIEKCNRDIVSIDLTSNEDISEATEKSNEYNIFYYLVYYFSFCCY